MRKLMFTIGLLAGLSLSAWSQISGPATVTAGQSATWALSTPALSAYIWSPDSVVQPGNATLTTTSVSAAKLGSGQAMTTADYPSVWYDSVSARWYAFSIRGGVTATASAVLYRLDLGSDPTPANISAANAVTEFNLGTLGLPAVSNNSYGGMVHAVTYDPDNKTWHLFWIKSGAGVYDSTKTANPPFRVRRLDFGNSLANTPGAAQSFEVRMDNFDDFQWSVGGTPTSPLQAPEPGVNCMVAQSKIIRAPNGAYLLLVGNRWGPPVRINFGTDIKNTRPRVDKLPRRVSHGVDANTIGDRVPHAALDVVQQNGRWFCFIASAPGNANVNGNQLWRYDLGANPADTGINFTLTGLGVISGIGTHSWGMQIAPSACGSEYYGFINQRGTLIRLNFGSSLINTPTVQTIGTAGQTGLPGLADNSGFFAYPHRDSLYAVIGGAGNNGIYALRLPYNSSGQPLTRKQPAANSSFTHTYAAPGTYRLTAAVNLHGGGAGMYCYTVNVVPPPTRPDQPGRYTVAASPVCQGQSSVTYTVPSVIGAATYHWHYTGSNVTYATSTTQPSNTLSFQTNAGNGTLRVWAVNAGGDSSSSSRDTAITVNVLPTINITPATASVCAGASITLTAGGATTYSWSHSGGNTAGATFTPITATTYTVTGTVAGCSATASRHVVYNLLPVTQVTATGGVTDICTGDSTVLTASGSGYSYAWKGVAGTIVGTGASYAARATGSYKVVATDLASGCSDSTQPVDIQVYNPPVVALGQSDTSFCIGGVIRLEVETQDTGLTYVWKQDNVSIAQANAHFLELDETGMYKVIVGRSTVASCEDSTNEVRIAVHDLPIVDITWDGVVLHATPGYASYQWNTSAQDIPGETDSVFTPSVNGGYSVTVTDANGCENTSSIQNLTDVGALNVHGLGVDVPGIYPNPSSGIVYVRTSVRVDVLVLTVEGRLLQQITDAHQIDLSSYADGIYFLRVTDEHGMTLRSERIIKNN